MSGNPLHTLFLGARLGAYLCFLSPSTFTGFKNSLGLCRVPRARTNMRSGKGIPKTWATELRVTVKTVAPRRSGLISKEMTHGPAHGHTAFALTLLDEFKKRETPWPPEDDG